MKAIKNLIQSQIDQLEFLIQTTTGAMKTRLKEEVANLKVDLHAQTINLLLVANKTLAITPVSCHRYPVLSRAY